MPREVQWFKNIRKASTKGAYENAIKDFMLFTGIKRPEEFRLVTRAHVIAWCEALGERTGDRSLIGMSIRHRLGAISSLFQYLCDNNAVLERPGRNMALGPWLIVALLVAAASDDSTGQDRTGLAGRCESLGAYAADGRVPESLQSQPEQLSLKKAAKHSGGRCETKP